jgi:D-sedoheptulose 7-phosphate isomerase
VGAHRASPESLGEALRRRLVVDSPVTATVQETHQVAIHLLCAAVDREVNVLSAIELAR